MKIKGCEVLTVCQFSITGKYLRLMLVDGFRGSRLEWVDPVALHLCHVPCLCHDWLPHRRLGFHNALDLFAGLYFFKAPLPPYLPAVAHWGTSF